MEVGLIISDKMEAYADKLRAKLQGRHTLCFSTNASSLRYPVISGDLSFVAWDHSVATSSIISLFHKISDLYVSVPFFLIEDKNVDDTFKIAIERFIQYNISDNFNLQSDMERFIKVINALPHVNEKERSTIRKIYNTVIGESQNMEDLRLFISRAAKNPMPVLIYGEAGSGKTLAAKTIHEASCKHSENFVTVDLQYIPENLMEEILFGKQAINFCTTYAHAKYTDASLLQAANNGTLFLKNIDKASLLLQTRLLEVLEEKDINFKLICSSERSLSNLVSEKKFRADLYYNINMQEFKIDALRDRREDIAILSKSYCESKNYKLHNSVIKKLILHDLNGNVPELFSMLNKAFIYSARIGIVYPERIRLFD